MASAAQIMASQAHACRYTGRRAVPLKPGSGTLPMPGILAEVIDLKASRSPPTPKGSSSLSAPGRP